MAQVIEQYLTVTILLEYIDLFTACMNIIQGTLLLC